MVVSPSPHGHSLLNRRAQLRFSSHGGRRLTLGNMSDVMCRIPGGRTQPCRTVVANVATAPTWPAAAGTPNIARAAFAGDLVGAVLRDNVCPHAQRRLSAGDARPPRLDARPPHEFSHPRGVLCHASARALRRILGASAITGKHRSRLPSTDAISQKS